MRAWLIIDGNNLLHLMHACVMGKPIGRLALTQLVGRYAASTGRSVTLVYDGPTPEGGLHRQFTSAGVEVRFSGGRTADEVILDLLRNIEFRSPVEVVTSDRAVQNGAAELGATIVRCEVFSATLFSGASAAPSETSTIPPVPSVSKPSEKPEGVSRQEIERWLEEFGGEELDLPPNWQI